MTDKTPADGLLDDAKMVFGAIRDTLTASELLEGRSKKFADRLFSEFGERSEAFRRIYDLAARHAAPAERQSDGEGVELPQRIYVTGKRNDLKAFEQCHEPWFVEYSRTQGASATLWKRDSTNEWVVDLHLQGDDINKTVRWSGPVKDDVINAISSECTQGAAVDVEALKKSIISWAFAECQPDRGDVFSWLDDNKDSLAEYLAAQGHLPAPSSEKGEKK